MGAATFGSLVEKNIKCAAWLSTVLLFTGLCVSALSMHVKSMWLLYVGCGVLCGLAEGIGYVTPVKNLLLWFGKSRRRALIMAISIVSFGLGSSICSYMFKYAFPYFGIDNVFFFFAGVYLLSMSVGSMMIDKPKYAKVALKKRIDKSYSILKYVSDSYFLQCWTFMFLNIAMGLVIIGQCAGMLYSAGLADGAIVFVMMLCGLSNGGGRLLFPAISDYMSRRVDSWLCALVLEIFALVLVLIDSWYAPISFIVVNACYGAGFACLPAVLNDHYGKNELSFIHGLCLSSWGFASLFAYFVSTLILSTFSLSQNVLFTVLVSVYMLNFFNMYVLRRRSVGV